VLAAGSLPANRWQRFIAIKPLLARLPPSLSQLMMHLTGHDPAPAGLLAQVAGEFGEEWHSLLIIRLEPKSRYWSDAAIWSITPR